VRDLKLEAHDHNVDNELGFAGTFFSTDAAIDLIGSLPEA